MPVIQCPYPDCTYATGDITEALACTMLTIHASGAHQPTAPTAPAPTAPGPALTNRTAAAHGRVERVRRPVITAGGTGEDWMYFTARWEEYTAATGVAGDDRVLQLLECCDEELRKDLTRNAGHSLAGTPEADVLKAIKVLAVREENIMVARDKLWAMHQDHDEPIRSFGARIRGQASMCNLSQVCSSVDCEQVNSFMDQILRDVLVRGLSDYDIRLAILQDTNQNMSLEQAFKFIEAKEAGKRSASKMKDSQEVAASRMSQYQRNQRNQRNIPTSNSKDLCMYCGKMGHDAHAAPDIREKKCSAYNTTCSYCSKPHHFEHLCKKKLKDAKDGVKRTPSLPIDTNNCLYTLEEPLCAISSKPLKSLNDTTNSTMDSVHQTTSSITLDHHVYNKRSKKWIKRRSQPQPFLTLDLSIHPEDYPALGLPPMIHTFRSASLRVMADTGCQSCLISYKLLRQLGVFKQHLMPVSTQMTTATSGTIDIMGCVVMRIHGTSKHGKLLETRQVVYVTENSNKLFLSQEACKDLGLISENFPAVGESLDNPSGVAAANDLHTCDCPKRAPPPPKPSELPFAATNENRHLLENYLLDYYSSSAFNTCTHQPLQMMKTTMMRLMIDDDVQPRVHHKPIPVPLHWQEKVKAAIDADCRMGVLEQVPIGEPVTYCHQMILSSRSNGEPRRTVDFQELNSHAIRETHHTQSPFHLARSIPHNTVKSVFDCWNGYHSVPLHPDDRHLTTFITPWGRYRYKVGPQGYSVTGDGYTRRFDAIVCDIQRKVQCIDDACLWDSNLKEAFFHAVDWLDTCAQHGITLNPEKFVFGAPTVEFAGFEITPDSVRPCQKSLKAITDFPTPQNITDVRSWFGLLNQVAYAFSVTDHMQPFRHLLKPGTPFQWTSDMDLLFTESKLAIAREIEEGVRIFDKSKPTYLATDWSKTGIGFWLYQKHCQCNSTKPRCCPSGWKVAMVGSRFTRLSESRYAAIEGEALAVVYALEKSKFFTLGCSDLVIAVDHKPLLGIFNDRSLDMPNGRLRDLKEKTLRYRFTMSYVPGAKNKAADTLSRYPSVSTNPEEPLSNNELASLHESTATHSQWQYLLSGICSVEAVDTLTTMQAVTWNVVKLATNSDKHMRELLDLIDHGFPGSSDTLPTPLRPYYRFRDDLFTVDGVALYRDRVIIPPALRDDILRILHSAHQGVTSMLSRAESTVFWPGITPAIVQQRERCNDCNRMAPSQPSAPPSPLIHPTYPFQAVCADFFKHHGLNYLVVVDRYSNYPIAERASEGSKGLIDSLKQTFVTFGIPDELSSDGGPEFTASDTQNFLRDWGIHHRQSSVAFPHSNCRAEIGVKTVKRLITSNTSPTGKLNTDAFRIAMLQYRNTPDPSTKLSPAMCVFGRQIKDFIPVLPGRYKPHPTWQDTLDRREDALRNRHMKASERWSEHTKRLPPLRVGDFVRLQNQVGPHPTKWDKTGRVIEVRQFDQYVIRVDGSGRATLRNRKFLRKYLPANPSRPPSTTVAPPPSSLPCPPPTETTEPATPPLPPHDAPATTPTIDTPAQDPPPIMELQPMAPLEPDSPSLALPTPSPSRSPPNQPSPGTPATKVPLALRRLASHNKEGTKGLGEGLSS